MHYRHTSDGASFAIQGDLIDLDAKSESLLVSCNCSGLPSYSNLQPQFATMGENPFDANLGMVFNKTSGQLLNGYSIQRGHVWFDIYADIDASVTSVFLYTNTIDDYDTATGVDVTTEVLADNKCTHGPVLDDQPVFFWLKTNTTVWYLGSKCIYAKGKRTYSLGTSTEWIFGNTYTTISSESLGGPCSCRLIVEWSSGDTGILMEQGGLGAGVVISVFNGVVKLGYGRGDPVTYSPPEYIVVVNPNIIDGLNLIEWSADMGEGGALWINGIRAENMTPCSFTSITGGNDGGTGKAYSSVSNINDGGWTGNGDGVYTNTIHECRIFTAQAVDELYTGK